MEGPRLEPADPRGRGRRTSTSRLVEDPFEPRMDLAPVLDRLHEVFRLGMEVDGQVLASAGRARRRRVAAAPQRRWRCTPCVASGRCGRSPTCRPRAAVGPHPGSGAPGERASAAATSPSARRGIDICPKVPGTWSGRVRVKAISTGGDATEPARGSSRARGR